ncbi:MAG: hypothetical protein QUU85_11365 [Candidatus Eisenbacteria bacterium]|nr:hypothetical protein [Candidatus Eisenbacteria bacterium]
MPVSLPVGEIQHANLPGSLRLGYGFTYSDTDHYYIGEERDDATETNVAPATLGIEHLISAEYDLSERFTVAAEVPFVHNEQSREFGGVAGNMQANGLGDIRLLARYWFAAGGSGGSGGPGLAAYVSLGARLPTGRSDGKFRAKNGTLVTKDLAAQEGTGNWAGIIELGGSRPLGDRFGLGATARYVFTPSATTVNNFRHELNPASAAPEKNSDSDAATLRVTFRSLLGLNGGTLSRFAARAVADVAWVPYDDLIGDTEGFRRAGPIVLVGPGLDWSPRDDISLSATVPLTVYRNVQQNGGNVQEWTLQLSAAWRFGPNPAAPGESTAE